VPFSRALPCCGAPVHAPLTRPASLEANLGRYRGEPEGTPFGLLTGRIPDFSLSPCVLAAWDPGRIRSGRSCARCPLPGSMYHYQRQAI